MANKTGKGGFKKGESGNPGGRPAEIAEVQELARTHTTKAIERLAYWMDTDNPKASVSAALALLNRAWGMPVQPLANPDGTNLSITWQTGAL